MNKLMPILVVAATLTISETCEAQIRAGAGVAASRWYRPAGGYYGPAGYGYSSTPVEGARRGQADVIRARGEAAESVSRASINIQEAKSKYIDNAAKWTETYWQRKRLGQAEIASDFARKRERTNRYLANKKSGAPPRLSPSQLDPTTGKLYWPEALLADEFTRNRKKLEELFLLRTHTSSTTDLAREVHTTARSMQSRLKSNIRKMQPHEYIAARKFLESLAYEGRFPTS